MPTGRWDRGVSRPGRLTGENGANPSLAKRFGATLSTQVV
jgi:hypothetical protein